MIIHPHGMLDSWAVQNSAWKKRIAGWLFEQRHLREAACIRALNTSEAKSLRDFGLSNPIAIIPNGMDLPSRSTIQEAVTSRSPALPRTLLYLGRIHPKKGLMNLLRAWHRVMLSLNAGDTKLETWQLAIAGWDESGHEEELKALCDQLGLRWSDGRNDSISSVSIHGSMSVIFLGPRFDDAKAASYRGCDAFILPSFSEGLPMVVLEAWSYCKPVLMTQACNLPEGFEAEAAIEVEICPESIADGVRRLIELTDEERTAMGERGRSLVAKRFNWQDIGAQLSSVNNWILNRDSKPDSVVS